MTTKLKLSSSLHQSPMKRVAESTFENSSRAQFKVNDLPPLASNARRRRNEDKKNAIGAFETSEDVRKRDDSIKL